MNFRANMNTLRKLGVKTSGVYHYGRKIYNMYYNDIFIGWYTEESLSDWDSFSFSLAVKKWIREIHSFVR